eukprot:9495956-Alexandrium_andersonii.AAC.1
MGRGRKRAGAVGSVLKNRRALGNGDRSAVLISHTLSSSSASSRARAIPCRWRTLVEPAFSTTT